MYVSILLRVRQNHLDCLETHTLLGPILGFLIQQIWGGAREFVSQTSSQVMLLLLVRTL